MAKKTILVDDLDGSENEVGTYRFTIDGNAYEIDLCPQNLVGLHQAVEPYTSVARKLNTRAPRRKARLVAAPEGEGEGGSGSVTEFNREQRQAIREWAREHGFEVADRGAFSKEVLEAYQEAASESG